MFLTILLLPVERRRINCHWKMSNVKGSLRDIAINLNREKTNSKNNSNERTLLFIGNDNVGKSNIIYQLIEKGKDVLNSSSTYLLEYKYARQSGKSLAKDVCHIWELGGGITFASLLSVFGSLKLCDSICVILVVDLSLPETIIKTMDTLLNWIKSAMLDSSTNTDQNSPQRSINIVEEEDKTYLDPFPVPLVIIGGKYDLFRNLEPTKKRIVCQYLRCSAHILHADLLFYSQNDAVTIKKVRDVLSRYGFGSSEAKGPVIIDINKPIRIPAGKDSFRSIQDSSVSTTNYSLEKYKNALLDYSHPRKNSDEHLPDDPASDVNFLEPRIDNLCAEKTEELKRMKEKILATRTTNKKS